MITHEIDLAGLSVCVGIPAGRDFHPFTVRSLLSTQEMCLKHGVPFQAVFVTGSSVIQWARDETIALFMETTANRLFWIDSDIKWEPEDFMRLLAISKHNEVVCASYPAKTETPTFFMKHDETEPMVMDKFNTLPILGAGLGFAVMNRTVIEEICNNAPLLYDEVSGKSIHEIFRVGRNAEGKRQGEDMAFFEDIINLGYRISLDVSIQLGHIGCKVYEGNIMNGLELTTEGKQLNAPLKPSQEERQGQEV